MRWTGQASLEHRASPDPTSVAYYNSGLDDDEWTDLDS